MDYKVGDKVEILSNAHRQSCNFSIGDVGIVIRASIQGNLLAVKVGGAFHLLKVAEVKHIPGLVGGSVDAMVDTVNKLGSVSAIDGTTTVDKELCPVCDEGVLVSKYYHSTNRTIKICGICGYREK